MWKSRLSTHNTEVLDGKEIESHPSAHALREAQPVPSEAGSMANSISCLDGS
jgi:hypothetical protein